MGLYPSLGNSTHPSLVPSRETTEEISAAVDVADSTGKGTDTLATHSDIAGEDPIVIISSGDDSRRIISYSSKRRDIERSIYGRYHTHTITS